MAAASHTEAKSRGQQNVERGLGRLGAAGVGLGLATVNTPFGIALKVDERRETSMPGIYAAGDLANPAMASVTTAISQGATAGISAQQSMLV
jgi:pyruvate/2-oxoglutarate dehydrogenase complex dihydrolipoamide dehydrogenase (E3) component